MQTTVINPPRDVKSRHCDAPSRSSHPTAAGSRRPTDRKRLRTGSTGVSGQRGGAAKRYAACFILVSFQYDDQNYSSDMHILYSRSGAGTEGRKGRRREGESVAALVGNVWSVLAETIDARETIGWCHGTS